MRPTTPAEQAAHAAWTRVIVAVARELQADLESPRTCTCPDNRRNCPIPSHARREREETRQ